MIALIISGIFFLLSLVILFAGYDWAKRTYKSGYYTALMFISMLCATCSILSYKNDQQFSTSQFYVEKTIKTESVNNKIVQTDTLIRIKPNDTK